MISAMIIYLVLVHESCNVVLDYSCIVLYLIQPNTCTQSLQELQIS